MWQLYSTFFIYVRLLVTVFYYIYICKQVNIPFNINTQGCGSVKDYTADPDYGSNLVFHITKKRKLIEKYTFFYKKKFAPDYSREPF